MQDQDALQDKLQFYEEECERLRRENAILSSQVTSAETKYKETQDKLDKIKSSFAWKLSKPLRLIRVFFIRLGYYRSPKKILKKIRSKQKEKRARKVYGKNSFPDVNVRKTQKETKFNTEVMFSVLVPLYNTPEDYLREMIESVLTQTYEEWQLCLADGSDAQHDFVGEICKEYADKDKRISYKKLEKNEGIAGNTNQCYQMANGNYIALFDHDDILHPSVLFEYAKVVNEQNADYIYCDEVTFENGDIDKMITLHFKPDYALDTLRANNYICHFSAFSRELLKETELFRSAFDGSQDHDMILRLTTLANKVVHVPKVLYYWRSHPGSVASDISAKTYAIDAAKRAVEDQLEHYGIFNTHITSTRAFETIFRLEYQLTAQPKVSIIICNHNHKEDLQRMIASVTEKATYANYEILIVENNSDSNDIFAYYDTLKLKENVKILDYQGEFNYSELNNFAVKQAEGEFLLLMNNDMQVITPNFIQELLMYAQRRDVGAVGAKLLFPNDTIQHAGIVIGLGADHTAGHIHYKDENTHIGYMGRLCYAQNVSAVTGACMMVRKEYYDAVGGLSKDYRVALNDVDFCLKLRAKNLLNVFTPFAELYHFESASRGSDQKGENAIRYKEECERFRSDWKEILEQGDPYYNPNFTLLASDYSLNV